MRRGTLWCVLIYCILHKSGGYRERFIVFTFQLNYVHCTTSCFYTVYCTVYTTQCLRRKVDTESEDQECRCIKGEKIKQRSLHLTTPAHGENVKEIYHQCEYIININISQIWIHLKFIISRRLKEVYDQYVRGSKISHLAHSAALIAFSKTSFTPKNVSTLL